MSDFLEPEGEQPRLRLPVKAIPSTKMKTQVFVAKDHAHLTPYLAAMHSQSITTDNLIDTFRLPLGNDKLLAWWKDRIAEVAAGTRVIIMLLNEGPPGTRIAGTSLIGMAMLAMPHSETSPFRARVESVIVNNRFRRRHHAMTLLAAIEEEAIKKGKTLLVSLFEPTSPRWHSNSTHRIRWQMAEVESQTPALALFKRLKFEEAGKVPKYSLNPGGELKDVVFLYKNLAT